MKRFLFLLALVIVAITVNAQKTVTLTVDTLQGAETVSFETFKTTKSYGAFTVQGLCTQLGGISDGTLTLYGSVDNTNWVFVNGVGGEVVTASPQASITGADLNQVTITSTLVPSWTVKDSPYKYWKIVGVGTAADTTKVNLTVLYQ